MVKASFFTDAHVDIVNKNHEFSGHLELRMFRIDFHLSPDGIFHGFPWFSSIFQPLLIFFHGIFHGFLRPGSRFPACLGDET